MDTNKTAPDKAKLKQWLVMGLIIIVFVGALYMILRPYLIKEDKVGNGQLLTDVPDADVAKLPEDKLSAYKGSDLVELGEEKVDPQLQRLYDEMDSSDDHRTSRYQDDDYPYEESDGYQSSEDMYAQFAREQEEQDQVARLQEQIDGLQREKRNLADEREYLTQLGEIKDRQIAANDIYSNAYRRASADPAPAPEPPKDPNAPVSFEAVGAKTVDPSIVSTLSQSGRDASSQQAHEALLQNRFTTSVGSFRSEAVAKNTIRAIIDETKTIKLGDEIKMRLMEDIQIGTVVVPKGTTIVAKSNLTNNRLQLKVTSIEYRERIIGVDLSAFDLNGQEGLYVPVTAEAVGLKALGEGLAETATGGISIQQSGKDQILANVSNGLIRAGGNYM
ncbi:conjugative transposon TraM protein, partial [Porphyromonas uenonis 60-3]